MTALATAGVVRVPPEPRLLSVAPALRSCLAQLPGPLVSIDLFSVFAPLHEGRPPVIRRERLSHGYRHEQWLLTVQNGRGSLAATAVVTVASSSTQRSDAPVALPRYRWSRPSSGETANVISEVPWSNAREGTVAVGSYARVLEWAWSSALLSAQGFAAGHVEVEGLRLRLFRAAATAGHASTVRIDAAVVAARAHEITVELTATRDDDRLVLAGQITFCASTNVKTIAPQFAVSSAIAQRSALESELTRQLRADWTP